MKHTTFTRQQTQGEDSGLKAVMSDSPRAPSTSDTQELRALDRQLLAAHARDDRSSMIGLYAQAAELARNEVACAFYLTQAWVFALDIGDTRAHGLGIRLAAMGRA